MIVIFGQPGVGKTTQGKILAANQKWCWISAGQLLRESGSPEARRIVSTGALVSSEYMSELVGDALRACAKVEHVIIDGFARRIEQAQWLIENSKRYNRNIEIVIVINVPKHELIERLISRGREDDTMQIIDKRLKVYDQETFPVLDYFKQHGVRVIHVDGSGLPELVHKNIMSELKKCKLV